MEILLVVLAGLYAICAVGYHKVVMKAAGAEEFGITVPARLMMYFFAAIWPLMVVVTMTKEAVN